MGLFDRLKSQRDIVKEEIKEIPWIQLDHLDQLEDIKERSKAVPVVLFKHSTTCGISRMVLKQFERDFKVEDTQGEFYFLDLRSYRNISQAIAHQFDVVHESPQLLIIKNGQAVYHASHGQISAQDVAEKL